MIACMQRTESQASASIEVKAPAAVCHARWPDDAL